MSRKLVWTLRLVAAGALLYLATFSYVWLVSRRDERRPAQAIVVLGAAHWNGRPSNVLRARLDHALELYEAGLAPTIVVTGGMGERDTQSEAMVAHRYLVSHDVPPASLVVRPEGRNTRESMGSVAEWANDRDIHRVLLVSDPFHMARLKAEAHAVDLQAYTSPTHTSPISTRPLQELEYLAAEAAKLPVVWLRLRKEIGKRGIGG